MLHILFLLLLLPFLQPLFRHYYLDEGEIETRMREFDVATYISHSLLFVFPLLLFALFLIPSLSLSYLRYFNTAPGYSL